MDVPHVFKLTYAQLAPHSLPSMPAFASAVTSMVAKLVSRIMFVVPVKLVLLPMSMEPSASLAPLLAVFLALKIISVLSVIMGSASAVLVLVLLVILSVDVSSVQLPMSVHNALLDLPFPYLPTPAPLVNTHA